MNLFESASSESAMGNAPLAARMRPRTLEEFVGQEQIVGEGRMLRRAIAADRVSSLILYGPPGSGKTTLAQIIANTTKSHFEQINAVTAGVADIRRVTQEAGERRTLYGSRTILFVDEIHRFNKGQQDALLPAVEDGRIVLIGATTENPFFEVNSPLISRSRIFRLEPLSDDSLKELIMRALRDESRGLGALRATVTHDALDHFVTVAAGDARSALNALELAVLTTAAGEDGTRCIDLATAEESIQQRALGYDKSGDNHYDTISAYIKSMRGSDPDAALYWLAKMLYAGEEARFIARRLVVHASEDVGMADPRAMLVAQAAAAAVELLGMPEARIPLAEATIYIACAPKSNACVSGIDAALEAVRLGSDVRVPVHLRDAHYKGAKQLGHGKGYEYPHSHPGNFVAQEYLPPELKGKRFYQPSSNGEEARAAARLRTWWPDWHGDDAEKGR